MTRATLLEKGVATKRKNTNFYSSQHATRAAAPFTVSSKPCVFAPQDVRQVPPCAGGQSGGLTLGHPALARSVRPALAKCHHRSVSPVSMSPELRIVRDGDVTALDSAGWGRGGERGERWGAVVCGLWWWWWWWWCGGGADGVRNTCVCCN